MFLDNGSICFNSIRAKYKHYPIDQKYFQRHMISSKQKVDHLFLLLEWNGTISVQCNLFNAQSNGIIKNYQRPQFGLKKHLTRLAIYNDIGFSPWKNKSDMVQYGIFNFQSNGNTCKMSKIRMEKHGTFFHHIKLSRFSPLKKQFVSGSIGKLVCCIESNLKLIKCTSWAWRNIGNSLTTLRARGFEPFKKQFG